MLPEERVFFEKYSGYLTTLLGEMASQEKLTEIQEKIIK
jgi:hypothetical protein